MIIRISIYLKTDGATQMGGDIADNGCANTDLDDGHNEAGPAAPVFFGLVSGVEVCAKNVVFMNGGAVFFF